MHCAPSGQRQLGVSVTWVVPSVLLTIADAMYAGQAWQTCKEGSCRCRRCPPEGQGSSVWLWRDRVVCFCWCARVCKVTQGWGPLSMGGQVAAAGDWCHSGMHAHSSPSIVCCADIWLLPGRQLADGYQQLVTVSLHSATWRGVRRLFHKLQSPCVCQSAVSLATFLTPALEDM